MATYFIRQNGATAQGPFDEGRISHWIDQGRVVGEMEISADGRTWISVSEHRLFAALPVLQPADEPPVMEPVASPPWIRGPSSEPVESDGDDGVEEAPADAEPPVRRTARRTVQRPAGPSPSGAKVVTGVIVVGVLVAAISAGSKGGDGHQPATAGAASSAFSDEVLLERVKGYLLAHLRDPDSLVMESYKTGREEDGSYWIRLGYRAKNGFGGYNRTDQVFVLDKDGNVLGRSDEGD